MANTFQGRFPDQNLAEDGFAATAPVASFPPNGYGLFDMAGNVWEWTSDWYRYDYYSTIAGSVARNPRGPDISLDPAEPNVPKRVMKGGSFLCSDSYCKRYRPGARGKGEPELGASNIGFRCARRQ
jgi:formylglycine-generating enzyme required for sulfatase activity